jgi:quercetin dioxygenase-like cupin family protein
MESRPSSADWEVRVRRIITGVDASGRSCVIEDAPLVPAVDPDNPGFGFALAAATSSVPPPTRPAGMGDPVDLGVEPGLVSWLIVDYAAGVDFPMHHTDTVDFDMLLEGSLTLALDDGEYELEPGDVVIVHGVDHGWKAGPDGCRLSVCSIGTPPPA